MQQDTLSSAFQMEVLAGTRIDDACQRAQGLTILTGGDVTFVFNDITLTATPETAADALVAQYEAETEAQAEAYRKTPEYQRYQKKLAAKRVQYQQRANTLIAELPQIVQDDAALARWTYDFFEASDLKGVEFDSQVVITALTTAGFTVDDVKQDEDAVLSDGHLYVRWLMANVMKCLDHWGHLPPITAHFGEEYARRFSSEPGSPSVPPETADSPLIVH